MPVLDPCLALENNPCMSYQEVLPCKQMTDTEETAYICQRIFVSNKLHFNDYAYYEMEDIDSSQVLCVEVLSEDQ